MSDGRNPLTAGVEAPPRPLARRRRRRGDWRRRHPGIEWLMAAIAMVIAAVVLGPFLFFHVVEGKAPSRLSLPVASKASASGATTPGPVSGAWKVGAGSQAGYRVQEVLFGQKHTAVGRTSQVSGRIDVSGSTVTTGDFTVQMATVKSDQAGRNNKFSGYIMDTSAYPTGTFRLTQPIKLGSVPAVGKVITAQATGALTLRGHTRTITFPIHAERTADAIDVNADIPLTFGLWHIPNPSFAIAQVGKTGTLEVLLHLVR